MFLWCHVRHLNLIDNHSNRINKKDKKVANTLDYSGIDFPISKKDYRRIEEKNSICINVFSYDNGIIYPIYVSSKKFNDSMDLLLIFEKKKNLIMCILKISIDSCLIKVKIRTKNTFVGIVYSVLVVKIF